MNRGNWKPDLVVVAAIALVGLAVAALSLPSWLRAAPLLALLFVLPGYGLAAALLPPRAMSWGERALLVLLLSISASILGALAVQLFFDLSLLSWATFLAVITWLACAAATSRRASSGLSGRPASALSGWRQIRALGARALGAIEPFAAVTFLAAAAVAIGAIVIAVRGVHDQQIQTRFSALWAVPSPIGAGAAADQLDLGLLNREGRSTDYRVRLRRVGESSREWEIQLDNRQRWERALPLESIPGEGTILVALYRDGELYSRAEVEVG